MGLTYSKVPEVFAHGQCGPTLFSQPQLDNCRLADMIGCCARAMCEYFWHRTVFVSGPPVLFWNVPTRKLG